MDNIKKVVSGGCSFTAGSELADCKMIRPSLGCIRYTSQSTWANWVQKKLFPNATVDNVGMPATDWGSCVRRVIYHIDVLLKNYDPQEIVVLIMWTSILRREYVRILPKNNIPYYIDDEDTFWSSLPSDADGMVGWDTRIVKQRRDVLYDEHLKKTVIDFYRKRSDKNNLVYYPLQQLEYLTSYLKSQDIKFYFTTASTDLIYFENFESNIFLDSMVKRLNLFSLIHTEDSLGFCDWATKNQYKIGTYGHPLEAAHKHWADKFCKFILNQRSLS